MASQIAVLEEQKSEDLEDENDDDEEAKLRSDGAELNSKSNGLNENPDINDVPMEESQVKTENHMLAFCCLHISILFFLLAVPAIFSSSYMENL